MGIMEFMQKFAEDKEFAARYQALGSLALGSLDLALLEAQRDGYSITKKEALAALQDTKSSELSDDELASVAGDKGVPDGPCLNCGCTELKMMGKGIKNGPPRLICANGGLRR